jgi:hypothetical protein
LKIIVSQNLNLTLCYKKCSLKRGGGGHLMYPIKRLS